MKLRNALLATAASLAVALPTMASAALVEFSNIVGAWSNGVPAANVTYNNTNALSTARWGDRQPQSGYNFTPVVGTIGIDVLPSGPFDLGTFEHENFVIDPATSITSIRLTVSADITINGTNEGTRNFVFNFTHIETPNGDDPCPYGGDNNQGVNINGCADRVTVTNAGNTEVFVVDGQKYTVTIVGFEVGGNVVNQFLTLEQAVNTATLQASVTVADIAVPAPASLALFGVGLAGLGIAARRRRAA